MHKTKLFLGGLVLGLSLVTVGCGNSGGGDLGTQVSDQGPSVEDEIKKIEANKNMPPQAKAAVIGQLRARQGEKGKRVEAEKK